MKDKVKTFSLEMDGGKLIDTNINNIIETLRVELQENELDSDDDVIEFTVRIEKVYTQEDLSNLPEFDGF